MHRIATSKVGLLVSNLFLSADGLPKINKYLVTKTSDIKK